MQPYYKTISKLPPHEGIMRANGLKTLATHGLNTKIGDYANFSYKFCHKLRYYVHMVMENMSDFGLK